LSEKGAAGILGVGVYLPPEIRKNDWWPEHLIRQWVEKERSNLARGAQDSEDPPTEGAMRTLMAMRQFAGDPFKGAMERRVMPEDMLPSDMEVAAAEEALRKAGVNRGDIDLLLVYSQVPDYLFTLNAPLLHQRLGLSPKCFSLTTDASCNSLLMQMTLAEQMILGGRARCALLVQSTAVTRLMRPEDHFSVWFGDGASALVVGPVSAGKGILGTAHFTEGSLHQALVGGVPGKRWYAGGEITGYVADWRCARNMLLLIADNAKESVDAALADAKLGPGDVDFYATHQSTYWFRKVTQEYIGLHKAKSFDSFEWTGSVSAVNIPIMLSFGEKEGLLKDGDVVAMHNGGSGIVYAGIILRWGR
jgi:3-oxoacyl-[acyl-carrier-protein] synthase-3